MAKVDAGWAKIGFPSRCLPDISVILGDCPGKLMPSAAVGVSAARKEIGPGFRGEWVERKRMLVRRRG